MQHLLDLEDIVRESIRELRKELGKQWLSNRMFGVRLHALVAGRLQAIRPVDGWYVGAEQPVRAIPFAPREILELRVLDFLEGAGMHMYRDEVARLTRPGAKVGDLRPDLVVRAPNGVLTIWDLTSQQGDHAVKTLLYAHVFESLGQLTHIGETYWLQKEGF